MEVPVPRRRNLEELRSRKMWIIITLLLILNALALLEILGCRSKQQEDPTPKEQLNTTITTQNIQTRSTTSEAEITTTEEITLKRVQETTAKITTTTGKPTTTENELVKNLLEMFKD